MNVPYAQPIFIVENFCTFINQQPVPSKSVEYNSPTCNLVFVSGVYT